LGGGGNQPGFWEGSSVSMGYWSGYTGELKGESVGKGSESIRTVSVVHQKSEKVDGMKEEV